MRMTRTLSNNLTIQICGRLWKPANDQQASWLIPHQSVEFQYRRQRTWTPRPIPVLHVWTPESPVVLGFVRMPDPQQLPEGF